MKVFLSIKILLVYWSIAIKDASILAFLELVSGASVRNYRETVLNCQAMIKEYKFPWSG